MDRLVILRLEVKIVLDFVLATLELDREVEVEVELAPALLCAAERRILEHWE